MSTMMAIAATMNRWHGQIEICDGIDNNCVDGEIDAIVDLVHRF